MNAIDLAVILVLALAVWAEASRGLVSALADLVRAPAALLLALGGYGLAVWVTGSPVAGIFVGLILAGALLVVSAPIIKRFTEGLGPSALEDNTRRKRHHPLSRIAGGILGVPLAAGICLFLLPVAARFPAVARAADASLLGARLLDRFPALYEAADAVNMQLPRLKTDRPRYERELRTGRSEFSERLNFRRLHGSTCIECGSEVAWLGYRRVRGSEIAPYFICPECGRRSDGCQTFEGFHAMYRQCPYEHAADGFELDCGVWPNERPLVPAGACPECGLGFR